jgi:hypothetical protein
MSDNRLGPWADLPRRVRERAAALRTDLWQWGADVRTDPSLIWRTTPIRVLFWLAVGVCIILAVRGLAKGIMPAAASGPAAEREATKLATLYVACTNPDCLESYITKRPMDFKDWPLICEFCGHPTVYRAKLCPLCHRWYANAPGAPDRCPFCAADEPEEAAAPVEPGPTDPDDAEDGW